MKRARDQYAKLLTLAKHYPCMNCGADDGTVVACHYDGPMGHKVGKGMGQKSHNAAIAMLCRSCHDVTDGRENKTDELTRLAIWATACANTWLALLNDGRVKIQ